MTQITPSVHMNLMKESAGVKGSATNIPISQTEFIFLRRLTLVTAKLKMKKTREQNLKYPKQKEQLIITYTQICLNPIKIGQNTQL